MWRITNMKTIQNMKNIALLLVLAAIMWANPVLSQEEETEYTGEVTIIAPYQPSIQDARKINIQPSIEIEVPEKKEVHYNIVPQKVTMEALELDPMRAVHVREEIDREYLKSNYIRGGIGNYKTAYGELFSTSRQSKEHRMGIHLKHISHGGDINDYATAQNSHNLGELFGEKYYKKSSLYGKAFFDKKVVHRYGFQPENFVQTYDDDDIKQSFTTFGANMQFENLDKKEEEFDYALDLSYYGWRDNYESLENGVNLNIYGEKPVELFSAIEYQSFGMMADMNFYNSGDSIEAMNAVNLNIKPYVEFKNGFYHLRAGVNLSMATSDVDDKDTELTIFPDLEAWIHMVPGYLSLTGGITGNKQHQSFRKLSTANPFIKSDVIREFTTYKIDTYGALTGNLMRGVDFNLQVNYQDIENYPLFTTDFSKDFDNEFDVVYDDLTITDFNGSISVKGGESFDLTTSLHYYSYATTNEAEAWHLPEMKISAAATINPELKIPLSFTAKATSLSGRYAKNAAGAAEELDDIFDLSISAQYEHTSALGIFVEVNNILAQNQYWYFEYPSYGMNILAGVSYNF